MRRQKDRRQMPADDFTSRIGEKACKSKVDPVGKFTILTSKTILAELPIDAIYHHNFPMKILKILCFQLKCIGDLLLTTPALVALARAYPEAEIHVAVDKAFSSLFPCLPVHRIHPLRGGGGSVWMDLLREQYDVCLDFNSSDRSAFASFLINSPLKITYSQFALRPFRKKIYNVFVSSVPSQRHTADFHADLLTPLGIQCEDTSLSIRLPVGVLREADALLEKLHVASPFVIVHPGTLRREKYWFNERWLAVIRHFREYHGLPVLLTGSSSYRERKHLKGLTACKGVHWHDLTGKLNLSQFAALISRARLLCGVDSAPIHLADAFSVPCVALFGPTNPFQWRPRNPHSRTLTPRSTGSHCPQDQVGAMEDISADMVISAIDGMLTNISVTSHALKIARPATNSDSTALLDPQ
ncbi:MAG: glycosyltransferase family 9 protein [Candidatus Xiphinematobacter sp.]|nr:MAG: glycosyltransferase family 9 protein [Candidatus Xiphinematobacter sp.]